MLWLPLHLRALMSSRASVFYWRSNGFHRQNCEEVGERLQKRNPSDYAVKYRLIKVFDPGLSDQQKQQALRYARDVVRLQPKRASAHAAMASVYYIS